LPPVLYKLNREAIKRKIKVTTKKFLINGFINLPEKL